MMKIITALKIISCFSNWQIALKLWLRKRQTDAHPLRILRTRSGIKFFCREGTSDCNTVVEIFFLDEYRLAFDYLDNFFRKKTIVDLGANFGLFSLLCAHRYHDALIKAYEPAPPNCKQIKANISLNKNLKKRISLIPFVVGPNKGTARLAYNKSAPASANLYSSNHNHYDLQVISFKNKMRKIHNKISLIKMDIEGAEYDLIKNTTAKDWSNKNAIALELHCDPAKQMSKRHFLNKFDSFGFRATRGPYIPYMLQRY